MKSKNIFRIWTVVVVLIFGSGIGIKNTNLLSNKESSLTKTSQAESNEESNTSKENTSIEISKDNIGQTITLQCFVESKYDHPDGHTFLTVLTSDNKVIDIPIFNNLNFDTSQITKNTQLDITGKISEYKGELQVIPQSKKEIVITSNGEQSNEDLVKISNITERDRGEVVQVRGIPTDIYESKGNLFFTLKDGNNKIKTVLFKADGNEIEGRKEKLEVYSQDDKSVRVLGTIDIYNNKVEIIIDKVFNND